MKLKPAIAYKIRQVIIITFLWVIINAFVELYNAVNYDPDTGKHFIYFIFGRSVFKHLLITAIGPLIGGLLGGSFIIFYLRGKIKGKTYVWKLLSHSLIYIVFVSFSILMVGIVAALLNQDDASFWKNFSRDIFSLRGLRLLIIWYIIVIMTIFLVDVSEKYGAGVLKKLLLGKYHSPGNEDRIFMFLDLTSSTTIAEKIGDEKYFQMLRYFYQVADEAIINNYGEIYQYIGDEIVISWERTEGLKNANCLSCFFAIRENVRKQAEIFLEKYAVVPDFKAALHSGIVTTGEIGLIKKDIVYSGDVLNTTSRMVALCIQYNAMLIISGVLYDELKNIPGYQFTYLDSPELRGKTVKLDLYSVEAAEDVLEGHQVSERVNNIA